MTLEDWLLYVALGFVAQLIDGAIGMAYGLTVTSVLLTAGLPPATASACVHAAEVFTTGASGTAHWRLGNFDRRLIRGLLLPGIAGGAIGAYVLTTVPGDAIRPWVSGYLLVLGIGILWRAWHGRVATFHSHRFVPPLGFFGGLLDAIGGGGWGAIVTSTLVGNGVPARLAIGSVNIVEFFVTTTIAGLLVASVGTSLWPMVVALVVGGVLAAPFAALTTRHLPERLLMAIVGTVIAALSLKGIVATVWR